jgi:hypothetical protein
MRAHTAHAELRPLHVAERAIVRRRWPTPLPRWRVQAVGVAAGHGRQAFPRQLRRTPPPRLAAVSVSTSRVRCASPNARARAKPSLCASLRCASAAASCCTQGLTGGSDASAVGSRNASRSASPMLAPADSGASAAPAEPGRERPTGGGLGLHVNVHGTSSGAGPATVSEGDGAVRRAVTAPGKAGRRSSIAAMPSALADGGDDDISDLLGLGDFGPPVERVDPAKARQAHTRECAVSCRRAFIGRGDRRAFIGRQYARLQSTRLHRRPQCRMRSLMRGALAGQNERGG